MRQATSTTWLGQPLRNTRILQRTNDEIFPAVKFKFSELRSIWLSVSMDSNCLRAMLQYT
jgi:hypothetical protein